MGHSCCSSKTAEIKPAQKLYDNLHLYRPLIIILDLSLVAAMAVSYQTPISFMNAAMGFFLLFLSALKFFNLQGFIDTFKTYDVLAQKLPIYGVAYPFIELGLGLLYFSGLFPITTNLIMIVVMLLGAIGILKVILTKTKVQCACVGTVFNLPVGKVTLSENLIMAIMASINLLHNA